MSTNTSCLSIIYSNTLTLTLTVTFTLTHILTPTRPPFSNNFFWLFVICNKRIFLFSLKSNKCFIINIKHDFLSIRHFFFSTFFIFDIFHFDIFHFDFLLFRYFFRRFSFRHFSFRHLAHIPNSPAQN